MAAVFGATALTVAASAVGPQDESAGQVRELTEEQVRDLSYDKSVLVNTDIDAATRSIAAERLLAMGRPEAIAALDEALRTGTPPIVASIVDVLARVTPEAAPPALIAPLVDAMRAADDDARDRLVGVLLLYGDDAVSALSEVALDREREPADRLGAIYGLGAFTKTASGDRLVDLVASRRGEPEAIRSAGFDALRRFGSADLPDDDAAWRAWWTTERRKPREVRLAEQSRRDRQRFHALRSENTALVERIVVALRQLYVNLTPEAQFEQLAVHLEDDLAAVRLFALTRIDVLLRDSVPITEAIQAQLVGCLDDPEAAARRRAAQILDQLGDAGLGALLAGRLAGEADPETVAVYLRALAQRPHPEALEPLIARLAEPDTSAPAAAALAALAAAESTTDEARQRMLAAVRVEFDRAPRPETGKLFAILAEPEDLAALEARLDDDDRDLADGVAAGFAARGHAGPLLARAADERMSAHGVAALLVGPPSLDVVRELLALTPSEAVLPAWDEAIRTVSSALSVADIIVVDDLLQESESATDELRETVLLAPAVRPVDAVTVEERSRVLRRLCPMLLARGDHRRAHELLETLNGDFSDAELTAARLECALRLGLFDEQVAQEAEAGEWIGVLDRMIEIDLVAARGLGDEIARRFTELAEDDRTRFEALRERMLARVAAEPTDGSGDAGP